MNRNAVTGQVQRTGALRLMEKLFRFLRWTLFFLALLATVLFCVFYRRANDELSVIAQRRLKAEYPDLDVSFGSIRLDSMRGVRLRDVAVYKKRHNKVDRPLFDAQEIYLECPITIKKLVKGNFKIRRILLARPHFYADVDPARLVEDFKPFYQNAGDPCTLELADATLSITLPGNANETLALTGINLTFAPKYVVAQPQDPPEHDANDAQEDASRLQDLPVQPQGADFARDSQGARVRLASYQEHAEARQTPLEEEQDAAQEPDYPDDDALAADPKLIWTLTLTASNPYVKSLGIDAEFKDYQWSVKGAIAKLDVAAILPLARALAPEKFALLTNLQGRVSLDVDANGSLFDLTSIDFHVQGKVEDGSALTPVLQYPLSDLTLSFSLDTTQFSLERLEARYGLTAIKAAYRQLGNPLTTRDPDAALRFQFEKFQISDTLLCQLIRSPMRRRYMSEQMSKTMLGFLDDYAFVATTNIDASFEKSARVNHEWTPTKFVATGRDVDLRCHAFPYQFSQLRARVEINPQGALSLLLQSEANRTRPVQIKGVFEDLFATPHGRVDITAKDQLIDSNLLGAVPDSSRELIEKLHPTGALDALVCVKYDPINFPNDPFKVQAALNVRDGSINYDLFPLPITNLKGQIYMRENAWLFSNLRGHSGASTILAHGALYNGRARGQLAQELTRLSELNAQSNGLVTTTDAEPASANLFAPLVNARANTQTPTTLGEDIWRFTLSADVQNFPLGAELRHALCHYEKKEDFERLQLEGKANGQIRIAYQSDQPKVDLQFDVSPVSGVTSAQPVGIPLELREIEGRVSYRHNSLMIESLRARNGRTTYAANVYCKIDPDGGWTLDLPSLRVDQLQIDRDLQGVASSDAAKFFDFFQPIGFFNVDGSVQIRQSGQPNAKRRVTWALRMVTQQNSARLGSATLSAICGQVKFYGVALENTPPLIYGEMNLDSFFYRDLQIAKLTGPFYYNGEDFFWGREAPPIQNCPVYIDPFLKEKIDAEPIYNRQTSENALSINQRVQTYVTAQTPMRVRAQAPTSDTSPNEPVGFASSSTQNPGAISANVSASSPYEPTQPGVNLAPATNNTALAAPNPLANWPNANDQRRALQSEIFQGQAISDGVILGRPVPAYRFTCAMQNATLEDVTRFFSPGSQPLKGNVAAYATLQGEGSNIATLRGVGGARVTDAELYEMPQIVRILQTLSVQEPDRTAFKSSVVDFEALGDRIKLTRVLLEGDALTVFGDGWLTLREQEKLIDLTLSSRLGNRQSQIPIVSDVLGAAGDQIAQIRVEGNLSSPVIQQERFPGVKKAWWSVFPDQEPLPTDKAPVEKARPLRDAWRKVTGADAEQ
ncbi:MAG: AsmA-like C-terminal domain-containing protein [Planctomycetia bacterium]|nr:AsmA-like C-terminal domain-containing protein [Planctomycetia bacterium]